MDKAEVKETLQEMIDKEHDDYEQFQYSDNIYLQVWSPNEEQGTFEFYAIVPHENVDLELVGRNSVTQLPTEISSVDEFYDDIDEIVKDVTGDAKSFSFNKMEIVDDGTWKRDATVYATHTLTA